MEKINCPDEYEGIVEKMDNATYKTLKGHQILDLKELVDEKNKSFKRNKAKDTKFAKCKQIYLSTTDPNFMSLSYYDSKNDEYPVEAVALASETWEIYNMKTTQEFQTHYLKLRGKTEEEIKELLPKMNDDRDQLLQLIPKKLKPGLYYQLTEKN